MSVNSVSVTIKSWLETATKKLQGAGITSAHLDAEILLSFVTNKPRTYIHAHSETILGINELVKLNSLISKRANYMPIAYLVGHKEFYGRNFLVTPDVLIPRPETEAIIENLKNIPAAHRHNIRLYDIGAGSGCLGITAKLEIPSLDVTLSDISSKSLTIAAKNAQNLHADVKVTTSDLLSNLPHNPDIILANLPYVDCSWNRSKETDYEPASALFATNGGLQVIENLLDQTSQQKQITLIIESDITQQQKIQNYAVKLGFAAHKTTDYVMIIQKV